MALQILQRCPISCNTSKSGSSMTLPFEESSTPCQQRRQHPDFRLACHSISAAWVQAGGLGLTISPMTWLSLRSVRFTPRMPKTTKTMAPVSTRGRTAGRPHTPPLQGLKPNVLDGLALAADEGSVKIESKKGGEKKSLQGIYLHRVRICVHAERCCNNPLAGCIYTRSRAAASPLFLALL